MRVTYRWPVAFAHLAFVSAMLVPYVYSSGPREEGRVAAVAVLALAVAAWGTAVAAYRAVPLDLAGVRGHAFRAPRVPDPGPLVAHRPWRGAGLVALWGAFCVMLGAMSTDLASDVPAADAGYYRAVAALAWSLAPVLFALALLWPLRLRRVARSAPVAVDLVGWTRSQVGTVWLLVAPAGATSLGDVVGIPLRKGSDPPPAFAGTLWVHGRLRPGNVAVVRAPDGMPYWPLGVCRGAMRLALRGPGAQPGA